MNTRTGGKLYGKGAEGFVIDAACTTNADKETLCAKLHNVDIASIHVYYSERQNKWDTSF